MLPVYMEGVCCLHFQKYLYVIYMLPVYMEGVPCLHVQKYLYVIYMLPEYMEGVPCLHVQKYLYVIYILPEYMEGVLCLYFQKYLYVIYMYLYVTCIYGGCLLSAFSEISAFYLYVTGMLPVYMEGVPCLHFQSSVWVVAGCLMGGENRKAEKARYIVCILVMMSALG